MTHIGEAMQSLVLYLATMFLGLGGGTMTGPILEAQGTAARPSYSFSADPNSGIYLMGDFNSVGLSTNGVTYLAGNPNGSVHVLGAAGTILGVGVGTADGAGDIVLGDIGSANSLRLHKYGFGANLQIQTATGSLAGIYAQSFNPGGASDVSYSRQSSNVAVIGTNGTPSSVVVGVHSVAKTANYTVSANGSDNGVNFTNTGAAGSVTFTITPAAEVYLRFTATAAQDMVLTMASGNLSGPGLTAASSHTLKGSTQQGSSADVVCDATNCYLRAVNGTVV